MRSTARIRGQKPLATANPDQKPLATVSPDQKPLARSRRGWVSYAPGCWRHRPWWKRAINSVLRFFQTRRRPARLLVVATQCALDHAGEEDEPPEVLGYTISRVLHL